MPTIGEKLKQAREARKLTIKQVVTGTRVRAHYLQAMEQDDFSSLPSPAQARGFLRLVAGFLGLDEDELVSLYRAEYQPDVPAPVAVHAPEPPASPPPVRPQPVAPPPPPEPPAPDPFDEPTLPPGPPAASQAIFIEIGKLLHERRELISLTLDEIERHTRVRKHNLELIEIGNFDELPSPVQARGILNAYASFLDMDTDAILLRYADALQARRIERRQESEPAQKTSNRNRISLPALLGRFISPDLIFGGAMILLLVGMSIWGAARIFSGEAQPLSSPTAGPSISDVLLATPLVDPNATLVKELPTSVEELGTPLPTIDPNLLPTETLPATVPSAVQITIVVLERTYLRVTVDGEIQQEGRVSPGAALTFDGNDRIEILTGSGSAVQILFNQADLGVMGSFGEVVDRIYTVDGIETPTPTPSATPSITPKPSITPRPSATPRPTLTSRPSSTPRPTLTPRPTATISQ